MTSMYDNIQEKCLTLSSQVLKCSEFRQQEARVELIQPVFTFQKSTVETPEQRVKST